MAYTTIALRTVGEPCIDEAKCAATITPGMLVEQYKVSSGVVGVRPHNKAGGNATPIFALANQLQGKEITDNYSSGDIVTFQTFRSGDEVYALIYASEAVVIGSKLESQGDGTLKVMDVTAPSYNTEDSWVATAIEDPTVLTVDFYCKVKIR
jgi:hypothetical protein